MRSSVWSLLAVVASGAACSDGPNRAKFGLDTRPPNPTCIAHARPVLDTGVMLARQWAGINFDQPIYLTQAPGDDARWYVVERQGTIRTFPTSATGDGDVQPFVSVAVNSAGEGGLLGFAFHPDWPSTRE